MTFSGPFFCINKIPTTGWPFHKGFVNAKSCIKISLSQADRGIITLRVFFKWCFPVFPLLIISFPWMDVVTSVPPIKATKGNGRKSVIESLPTQGLILLRRLKEWKQDRDDAPAGRDQPLQNRDHGASAWAWTWGNAGCQSVCSRGLRCFLPLNHVRTQRAGKSAPTNHPRLLCYIAFRIFDLSLPLQQALHPLWVYFQPAIGKE